jgi:amino-acid N-acetyltransferase
VKVRTAKIDDAKAIYSLISSYAERDKMLFRSMADIYENIQSFFVAEQDGLHAGCCALQVIWSDLAEIKSLAVAEAKIGSGVGKALVVAAVEGARDLGVKKVFALTLKPDFFGKMGFQVVNKDALPMKVWSDCARCPKQQNCDEIAVIRASENDSQKP